MAEDKTYSQMKQEFTEFYHNKVKDRLPAYIKMRREEGPMQIAFWGVWYSFLLLFVFLLCQGFADTYIYKILPQLKFFGIIVKIFLCIDIVALIVSILALIILDATTSNKTNTKGGTRYIKSGLEMELKRDLMPKFVRIFFDDGFWGKQSNYTKLDDASSTDNYKYMMEQYNEYIRDRNSLENNRIKNLRDLKILNPYPWARYDDVITGTFKDVKIKISEVDTIILKIHEIGIILFLTIWLVGISGGLIALLFLLFILPGILIACLIFSYKIMQYSLFRGVVVEFDMNKNFKGHTIFHENSSLAKKIPLDKNKYQKVNLESVTFENKYNVYSTDQIEARYILTPSLIERIENLKFAFKAKYVRGSFLNNKLTLAIHTGKDMFAMGSDFKDSDVHTFEELYDDMISVLQIVDELKLNEHTGL